MFRLSESNAENAPKETAKSSTEEEAKADANDKGIQNI